MSTSNEIEKLIYTFSKLPGLGPRSARRIVFHLLKDMRVRMMGLIDILSRSMESVKYCGCGNIDTVNPCRICSNHKRKNGIMAIVTDVCDLWAIERVGLFNGIYYVFGSVDLPNDSSKIHGLIEKIKSENIKEVVLAMNSTIDGQTAAYYIMEYLKPLDCTISKLAIGIPVGGELDHLDEGTLAAAFKARTKY